MCAANFQNFIVTTLTMAKMQTDVLYSVYACVPRMQNHMPRRRPICQIILFLTLLFFGKASRVLSLGGTLHLILQFLKPRVAAHAHATLKRNR